MGRVEDITREIEALTAKVDNSPRSAELYVERAKRYLLLEQFDKALNDYIMASEIEPKDTEITQSIEMIKSIFNYRNIDIYNP